MKKLIFGLMILFASSSLFSQTGDEIMQRAAKAMNSEGLKKINTMKIVGSQFNAAMGQELATTFYIKRPNKVRMEIEYMGQSITSAYDGNKGWIVNPLTGSTKKQDIPEEGIGQFTQIIDMVDSPLSDYGEEGSKYEADGTETLGEKTYNKVKVTDKDSSVSTLYFDALTDWFYKAVVLIENEDKEKNMVVEIVYEEKTKKGGVILPSVIEINANGEKNGIMKFDEYEINLPIDDKLFENL